MRLAKVRHLIPCNQVSILYKLFITWLDITWAIKRWRCRALVAGILERVFFSGFEILSSISKSEEFLEKRGVGAVKFWACNVKDWPVMSQMDLFRLKRFCVVSFGHFCVPNGPVIYQSIDMHCHKLASAVLDRLVLSQMNLYRGYSLTTKITKKNLINL